jgi:hypothetical protein
MAGLSIQSRRVAATGTDGHAAELSERIPTSVSLEYATDSSYLRASGKLHAVLLA